MKRRWWKFGGSPYTLFALSPFKQSPRIVAIILTRSPWLKSKLPPVPPKLISLHWIHPIPVFESRAVNWNPSFSWTEKKEIKNKEWETMEDNEGCFHLFFFFFFFPNQTSRFTVVVCYKIGWRFRAKSFVHRIERNFFFLENF